MTDVHLAFYISTVNINVIDVLLPVYLVFTNPTQSKFHIKIGDLPANSSALAPVFHVRCPCPPIPATFLQLLQLFFWQNFIN